MSWTNTPRRDESLGRAFEFVALLVGRESITLRELAEHFECSYRTAIRYMHAARNAGLVDVDHGRGHRPTVLRLVNRRLRRA